MGAAGLAVVGLSMMEVGVTAHAFNRHSELAITKLAAVLDENNDTRLRFSLVMQLIIFMILTSLFILLLSHPANVILLI